MDLFKSLLLGGLLLQAVAYLGGLIDCNFAGQIYARESAAFVCTGLRDACSNKNLVVEKEAYSSAQQIADFLDNSRDLSTYSRTCLNNFSNYCQLECLKWAVYSEGGCHYVQHAQRKKLFTDCPEERAKNIMASLCFSECYKEALNYVSSCKKSAGQCFQQALPNTVSSSSWVMAQ